MTRAHASLALLAALLSANGMAEEQVVTEVDNTEEETTQVETDVESIDEEVVAVGYMFQGEMAARDEQRSSNKIANIISADGIGKLPDRNAAEAVQRLPGVSIERDQGEGRFVAVRGMPSQWSSTSINGNRLPTAEEETTTRATAFDFFPTEMIESVRVSKAVTADMEGDAIGGNVDFITKTAPEERTLDVTAGYNYNDRAEKGGYNANILWGDRTEDGKFGYMVNATTWKRDWATDNYEPRRKDNDDGVSGIRRLELRDYTGTRETKGLNTAAEYNFDNGDRVYGNAIYGTLEDDEYHYKHRYRFDKDRVELQHIHNLLITEMWGAEVGGEHFLNNADSKLEWSLASYENKFYYGDVPNTGDNSYFVMRFDQTNVGFEGLGDGDLVYNKIDGGSDSADSISNHLPDGFEMDPTQMALQGVELYKVEVTERDKAIAKLDFTHILDERTELKFGGKYRLKERNAFFADEFYVWDEANYGPAPTLSDFDLMDQPGRDDFLPEVDENYSDDFSQVADVEDLENFWNDNKDKFILDTDESVIGPNGRTFDVEEQQLATYGMATYELSDELTLIGGLRLEHTTTEVDASGASANASDLTNDYLSVLPSVHAKYALNDDANVRAAITRTFARPDFGDIAPDSTFIEADLEYFGGNPELNPTYSINYDLMYDMYFGDVGVFSAGLFYKDISDTIYREASTITYNGNAGVTAIRPENAGSAWLGGVELAYGSRLDLIHDALYNFGVNVNMTKMESEMEIKVDGEKRNVAIPRQADLLYNLAFFYDDSTWAARIAMNYKGEYIEEHGSDSDHDRYYGEYTSLDFSGSYKPLDNLMVYMELNNLGNSELKYYQGDEDRPSQVEYYGMRGTMGVKYSFF